MLQGKTLKIYVSHTELTAHQTENGRYDTDGKKYLRFAASDGWLYVDELQLEGKKRMGAEEFLRGFRA